MKIGYVVTLFIDKGGQFYDTDIGMTRKCFESLTYSDDVCLFIYNQGGLSEEEVHDLLKPYNLEYYILGSGVNVGIPKARYTIINHILTHYPEIQYIAEIHLDMIFMPNWHLPLVEFLQKNEDPMVCPRIVQGSDNNFTLQDNNAKVQLSSDLKSKVNDIQSFTEDKVINNFTNPVIYKAEALRGVHYYDIGFLTGKQTYEDTSLLIAFRYYMGTRYNWVPRCYLKSCVYHQIEGQRLRVMTGEDASKNLMGMVQQFGAYGIEQWAIMDNNNFYWHDVYKSMIIDKDAYNSQP